MVVALDSDDDGLLPLVGQLVRRELLGLPVDTTTASENDPNDTFVDTIVAAVESNEKPPPVRALVEAALWRRVKAHR